MLGSPGSLVQHEGTLLHHLCRPPLILIHAVLEQADVLAVLSALLLAALSALLLAALPVSLEMTPSFLYLFLQWVRVPVVVPGRQHLDQRGR